jgi:hypothetical protein
MVERRLYLIFFALALFVSVLHGERARNDHLQDDEFDFNDEDRGEDGRNYLYSIEEEKKTYFFSIFQEVIDTIKRFLLGKKTTTTTQKPSSDAISALITTTPSTKTSSTTKASAFDGLFNKKSSTTSTTTSRYNRIRSTTGSPKDACGIINPCKNGGTCKTLSSGRYYCFCTQDYYGKTCDNSK